MRFKVRFTEEAQADLERLYGFLLEARQGDWGPAEGALDTIRDALALLEVAPFSCRRVRGGDACLRELVIGFGASGYVALFEVDGPGTVTVLAVRHQREDDYH